MLDFSDVLQRAVELLARMDEFSQSRYRLEGRYHHVLVDEFQDTSRTQWELISLLVKAWGKGSASSLSRRSSSSAIASSRSTGSATPRSPCCRRPAGFIDRLRPGTSARRTIARSFRAVPGLLAFVNDLFAEMAQPRRSLSGRVGRDDFAFDEADRFPDGRDVRPVAAPVLGTRGWRIGGRLRRAVAEPRSAASSTEDMVRDRQTGLARRATPGDIGILFRSRTSHREFERALDRARYPDLRLQRAGLLRRRRDQGSIGADPLPGEPVVRSPRGRVPSLPVHPPVGRRPRRACASCGRRDHATRSARCARRPG